MIMLQKGMEATECVALASARNVPGGMTVTSFFYQTEEDTHRWTR